MPGTTFDIGSLAAEAGSSILGIGLGYLNDARQYGQQQKLQRLQMQGNKEMVDYNMYKQLQMWKATNYQAQVEQMMKAGLNPALLYGMSGGGGSTTGNATGQVQGATAPQGGREIQDMLGMGMQMQLLSAQKELIQAQTEKTKGEAANLPATGENIKADTELKQIDLKIKQIEEFVKGKSQNMAIAMLSTTLQEETEKLHILQNEQKISTATINDKIKEIQARAVGAALQNALTIAQKSLTDKETWAIGQRVVNEAWMMGQTATTNQWNAESNAQNAQTSANQQRLNEWINDIQHSTGLAKDVIEKILQALVIKGILQPGRNPIQGFRPNN